MLFSAKIISENGGLVLEAGHNKNLTLRTSGSGKVNINLNDLSSLASQHDNPRGELHAEMMARMETLESTLSGDSVECLHCTEKLKLKIKLKCLMQQNNETKISF